MIYHISRKEDWDLAEKNGFYETASLTTEGFIHASGVQQVAGVLERYFQHEKNLILLHIDEEKLTSPVKYQLAESIREIFPHIFGRVNLEAIVKTEIL